MNPSFGLISGLFSYTDIIASQTLILYFLIKYAITMVALLLLPDMQCTNTFPFFKFLSMN